MKYLIAALLLSTQAHAACGPISCDEEGYRALGRDYSDIRSSVGSNTPEPGYRDTYEPQESVYDTRPTFETRTESYERLREQPSVSPLGQPNINKPSFRWAE